MLGLSELRDGVWEHAWIFLRANDALYCRGFKLRGRLIEAVGNSRLFIEVLARIDRDIKLGIDVASIFEGGFRSKCWSEEWQQP